MNRWMCSRSGDPDFHQLERVVFGRPDVGRRQICFVDVKEVSLTGIEPFREVALVTSVESRR